jgi:hypothetical protein
MKKYILSSLVAVFLAAMFASCNKSSTCECTVSASVMGYTQSETVTTEYDGSCSELEKDATGEIAEAARELEAVGGKVTIKCREK